MPADLADPLNMIKEIIHMGLDNKESQRFNLKMKMLLEKIEEQSNKGA